MTFKEFVDKYMGMIIGIIIALLLIAFNMIYAIECIIIVVALGWFGSYVQKNRDTVKDKLKVFIDKF